MNGIEYASINAKIRNWIPLLLTPQDADHLVRANLTEIADFIRKHEIKVTLEGENISQLESGIKQAIVDYVKSGSRFLSGSSKDFMNEWLKSYEIENVKIIARALVGKRPVDFLYKMQSNSRFNMEAVKNIHTVEEYQEFLRGTKYYEIGTYALPRIKESANAFYFEMMLDNYYAQSIKETAKKLGRTDFEAVKKLLFFSLEMSRVMWIYRLRFQYKMTTEQTLSYVPNIFNILPKQKYLQLIDAGTHEEFVKLLLDDKIIRSETADIADLEKALNNEIYHRASKYRKTAPFSIAMFLSFIVLKSITVRSFIVLLEGKRHNLDPNLIRSLIVV